MQRKDATQIQTVGNLGHAISQRRKALGMTQTQLSALSGVAQPNLSNLERGVADGRLETYLKICALVGIDLLAVPRS